MYRRVQIDFTAFREIVEPGKLVADYLRDCTGFELAKALSKEHS